MTLYSAGLRFSEAAHLRIADIDFGPNADPGRLRQGKEGTARAALAAGS